MRRLTIVATAIAVIGFALTSLLGGAAQASATSKLHLVPGDVAQLNLATLLHAAPATQQVEIGVGVARPDPAGEQKLYSELYDKTSSLYHHFLTVKQFNARFGVTSSTTNAVRNFLANAGLKIVTSSGGDYFIATGSVAQVDQLLKVKIGDYSYKGLKFYANNVAPSVPTTLPIDAIAGLDNVHKMSLANLKGHKLANATAKTAVAAGRRVLAQHAIKASVTRSGTTRSNALGVTSQDGDEQVYTPQDLWGMYDDPGASSLVSATGTTTPAAVASSSVALGQGQTMGIFTDGETASVVSQLRYFEQAEGLPKVPVRTYETEGSTDSNYGDNTGAIEWYLDSQSSTGISPDAKQLDFFTSKSIYDADIAASFSYWANDPTGPKQVNASFGECEEDPTNAVTGPLAQQPYGTELGDELEAMAEPILRQATIEGRTLFSSAGDTGSGCPEVVLPVVGAANGLANQPVPIVSYPCASAYDVCVGGTVLSSPGTTYPDSAKRSAETSWMNGGGGTSYFITAPTFQDAVANVSNTCVSTADGSTIYATSATAPICRGVPDVADLSGNTEGDAYFIYIDDAPSSEGGTSLSSPLMMGQWTRIQSAASTSVQSEGGLGYADPVIYGQAASADKCTVAPCTGTYASDFYDVTASEDVGDLAGSQGAGSIDGINGINTGIGLGNGTYNDTPGWDYASGWGSLNVSNFMTDVDKSTTAPVTYTGAEQAPISVCTASTLSPTGNATDPVEVQLGSIPAADITNATLSASATAVTATFTVPDLSSGAAPYGTDIDFTTSWIYNGKVYTATADDAVDGFSYTDSATTSNATGTSTATSVTITIPTKDVGSPPVGALLQYPQAFSAVVAAILPFTADSADNTRLDSVDDGQLDSIGESVVVGGVLGSTCNNTLPVTNLTTAAANTAVSATSGTTGTSTGTGSGTSGTGTTKSGTTTATSSTAQIACEKTSKLPVTHITKKSLKRTAFVLSGTAAAHCPDTITKVGLSIARTVIKKVKKKKVTECQFLTAKHKWTAAGSCAPRDYFTAKGLGKWSFSVKLKFTKGTYRIWEHATDNKKYTTKNVASKFVFVRFS